MYRTLPVLRLQDACIDLCIISVGGFVCCYPSGLLVLCFVHPLESNMTTVEERLLSNSEKKFLVWPMDKACCEPVEKRIGQGLEKDEGIFWRVPLFLCSRAISGGPSAQTLQALAGN
jgi:hypothetical protein